MHVFLEELPLDNTTFKEHQASKVMTHLLKLLKYLPEQNQVLSQVRGLAISHDSYIKVIVCSRVVHLETQSQIYVMFFVKHHTFTLIKLQKLYVEPKGLAFRVKASPLRQIFLAYPRKQRHGALTIINFVNSWHRKAFIHFHGLSSTNVSCSTTL